MNYKFKEININFAPVQHIECGQTALYLSTLVGVGDVILHSDVMHIDGTRGAPNEKVRCGHCGDWLFTRTRRFAERRNNHEH